MLMVPALESDDCPAVGPGRASQLPAQTAAASMPPQQARRRHRRGAALGSALASCQHTDATPRPVRIAEQEGHELRGRHLVTAPSACIQTRSTWQEEPLKRPQ